MMTLYTVQIMFHGEPNPLYITTDKDDAEREMKQVINNFVSNNAGKPNIWISCKELNNDAKVFYDYDWYSDESGTPGDYDEDELDE
jgi:hypothetical protein